jgi:NADH-quinone oxidoreductase subunit J
MSDFLFYIFSSLSLFVSFSVISATNPVNSVLFLVLSFISNSILLFLLQLEFLPLILIVVYVGAIAVLFLFVVMMLNIKLTTQKSNFFKYFPVGSLTAIFWGVGILSNLSYCFTVLRVEDESLYLYKEEFWFLFIDNITNVEALGQILYSNLFLFFLIAGVVLLVAMIGSVVLTQQYNKRLRSQYIFRQLSRSSKKALFFIQNP